MGKKFKNYSPKLLEVMRRFGIAPELELRSSEKMILEAISEIDDVGFYDICDCFDMKPSKVETYLADLEDQGLIDIIDETGKLFITEDAVEYLNFKESSNKSRKKFRKFLECLSDKELDDFMELVNRFEFEDEAEDAEAENADENSAETANAAETAETAEAAEESAPEADETAETAAPEAVEEPAAPAAEVKTEAAEKPEEAVKTVETVKPDKPIYVLTY